MFVMCVQLQAVILSFNFQDRLTIRLKKIKHFQRDEIVPVSLVKLFPYPASKRQSSSKYTHVFIN